MNYLTTKLSITARWSAWFFTAALICTRLLGAGNIASYNFSTLAGASLALDHTDGTGENARFYNPNALAVDSVGNVYVADTGDHTIRKVSPDGIVTTFAGDSGQTGSADGTGASARFNYPVAVAVDGAGNLYVTDMGDHSVRKITPGGIVTTLVGITAGFNAPQGVAVDGAGNVYVADTNNNAIRKVTPGGFVSTFAGTLGQSGSIDGAGSGARFNVPCGLSIDASGNVFVADFGNDTIRKITPAGLVSTVAGKAGLEGSQDGVGNNARFNHPGGVTVDGAGMLYVADTTNHTLRKITPGGVVSTFVGKVGVFGRLDGAGGDARFDYPFALAVNGSGGAIYVADRGNHAVRMVTTSGVVTTLAGSTGLSGTSDGAGASANFFYPDGIAVDGAGVIYVADRSNQTIRKVTAGGIVTTFAGGTGLAGNANGTGIAARFNDPTSVAADTSGNVYVADCKNHSIRKITSSGVVTTFAGGAGLSGSVNGTGPVARFNSPQGIAVDSAGNVYVADTGNNTVRKITSGGVVSTMAGTAGQSGGEDGTGAMVRFNNPYAVAVDTVGNVYVSDFNNGSIRKITSVGVTTTLAGTARVIGNVDATGTAARFSGAYGLAVDFAGNVLVTDTFNHTVRRITPGGDVTTVTGAMSRFYYPEGIAVDTAGTVYVADGDNHGISKGVPGLQITGQTTNQSAQLGGSVTFGVATAGGTFSYQWFKNGVVIKGATGSTYTFSSAQVADAGTYRVQVNDGSTNYLVDAGTFSITSPNTISSVSYAVFTKGVSGTHTFTRNIPCTWKITGLPAWAKLNVTTGQLTGIPPATATTTPILVTAIGAVTPNPTQTFTVVIKASPAVDFAFDRAGFIAAVLGRTLNGLTFTSAGTFTVPAETTASAHREGIWMYEKDAINEGVVTLQYSAPEPDEFAGFDLVYTDAFHGSVISYAIVNNNATGFSVAAFDFSNASAPSDVSASDRTFADKVQITWTAESWSSGYQIYRSETVVASAKPVLISGKTLIMGSSYNDTKAVPGKTYYYRVAAVRLGSVSGLSATDAGTRFIQQGQTITFTPPANKKNGDAPFALTATSTSGLPVILTLVSGPATLSGNILTLTGAGKVVLQATQPGNRDFTAAKPLKRTLTVAKAP